MKLLRIGNIYLNVDQIISIIPIPGGYDKEKGSDANVARVFTRGADGFYDVTPAQLSLILEASE